MFPLLGSWQWGGMALANRIWWKWCLCFFPRLSLCATASPFLLLSFLVLVFSNQQPSCKEAQPSPQITWIGPHWTELTPPTNSHNQTPAQWVKGASDDSSASRWAAPTGEKWNREELIPTKPCPNYRFMTQINLSCFEPLFQDNFLHC